MFADANWKALNLKKTRYFIEWNTIDQPGELAKADAFVAAARTAGVSVLMHISTDDINSTPRRPLPSNSAYKSKVGALVARYRAQGVKDWGVWNEANHKSQPTAKNPKRAADFYKTFRKFKCKGCKIVALDVLDQAGVEKYIAQLDQGRRLAGQEGEDRRGPQLLPGQPPDHREERLQPLPRRRADPQGDPQAQQGGEALADRDRRPGQLRQRLQVRQARQSNRTKYMFDLIKKYDKNIERLYSYNYFGNGCTPAFDGGLVEADGTPRAAYNTFKSQLKNTSR